MRREPRALFISHGAGPLPLLDDPDHQAMVNSLITLSHSIQKPSAVIVISAHWSEDMITITNNPSPSLLYDYHEFGDESYQIEYPCIGDESLSREIYQALMKANIPSTFNSNRDFDHGVFVPLKLMYPEADIPCVQVSLNQHLDPNYHVKVGEALGMLKRDNVLIIGSGFSFHNVDVISHQKPTDKQKNQQFETWLGDVCTNNTYSEDKRIKELLDWNKVPSARYCHPKEEHLLPLYVCYGVTQAPTTTSIQYPIRDFFASSYYWD